MPVKKKSTETEKNKSIAKSKKLAVDDKPEASSSTSIVANLKDWKFLISRKPEGRKKQLLEAFEQFAREQGFDPYFAAADKQFINRIYGIGADELTGNEKEAKAAGNLTDAEIKAARAPDSERYEVKYNNEDNIYPWRVEPDLSEQEALRKRLSEYSDPAEIKKEFFQFDINAVTEIRGLEKDVGAVAQALQYPDFKVTLANDRISQGHHSRWESMNVKFIENIASHEDANVLDLAQREIGYLRSTRTKMQALVFDRLEAVLERRPVAPFRYVLGPRPADQGSVVPVESDAHRAK